MDVRATWSKITFPKAFVLPGSETIFAPGEYDLVIEEERLQGLTFNAYRRTSAFLQVSTNPRFPRRTELRPVTDADLHEALGHASERGAGFTGCIEAGSFPCKEAS